jgi:hypothetical protein
VGIAVIARWPASGISSQLLLTLKTFHRNATIIHATQKSLDYFINRFLRFYQTNATKVYTKNCILHSFYTTRSVGALLTAPTNSCHNQACYKTLIIINNILCIKHRQTTLICITHAICRYLPIL